MAELRPYTPADRDGCLRLIREGHDPDFSSERFAWLHEDGPGGPSAVALYADGDAVLGIYSVVRKTLRLNGRELRGGRDVDPVVHPSCRGRGVFTRLLDFGLENFTDLDVLFNFANPASAKGFRRRGWRDVTTLDDKVCRLTPHGAGLKDLALWALTGVAKPRPDGEIREPDVDEIDALLRDQAPRFAPWEPADRIGVARTPEYLTWRYRRHPLHAYRWFLHRRPDGAFALAVVRHEPERGRLLVCDAAGFGAAPDLGAWLRLWSDIFPAATAVTWATQPAICLTRFTSNPLSRGSGLPLLVKPFPGGEAPEGVLKPEAWRLTPGDLEIS